MRRAWFILLRLASKDEPAAFEEISKPDRWRTGLNEGDKTMTRKLKSLPLALLALTLGSPAALAQSSGLASYEATYRLTLADIDYKGAVITAKGAMAMRVKRDCTRWQSHSEFLFLLELDSGDKIRTHSMFRQRESLDGQNIQFVYWQDISGVGREEYRGSATIPTDGEAGTVNYVKPKRFERKLPKGVEMPITAMRQIVEGLITEGTTAKHNYFDPQAKFVEIRSIGGEPIILATPTKGDAGLVDGRSWRLQATPIPEGEEDDTESGEKLKEKEEKNYTIIQIHDTGVASFMKMKSGITTINAELTEVKELPPPNCNRPKPPELELSTDCIDGMTARKEEDVAEGGKPKEESGMAGKVTDCESAIIELPVPGEGDGEDVEAAPVEDVDKEAVEDIGDSVDSGSAIVPEIINASTIN